MLISSAHAPSFLPKQGKQCIRGVAYNYPTSTFQRAPRNWLPCHSLNLSFQLVHKGLRIAYVRTMYI